MKPVPAAGGILFRKESGILEFLLLQNARHGTWGFPKGHAEKGENPKACARREILEETGFLISDFEPGFREVLHYHVPPATRKDGRGDYDKEVVYFLAPAPLTPPTLSSEHKDHRWVSREEAQQLLAFNDLRHLLDKAWAFLQNRSVTKENPGDKKQA